MQVESNIKWSIASNTAWAKVNKGVTVNNDNITITVSPATTPEETEAVIVVKPYGEGYDAGSDTVYITRGSTDATSLTVDPESIDAPENGGSYTINVSSTAQWRVYKSWDMEWVTFTGATEGNGSGSFGISVDAATSVEALSGIITIEEVRSDNYKPVKTQVYIERAGKAAASLSVTPTTINAPAEGGDFSVNIQSNYSWTARVVVGSFFSISAKSGEAGESTLIVTVNPATSETEKTGYIIVNSSFGGEQARINIKREGKEKLYVTLGKSEIESPAEGGTYKVSLTSNTSWTVSSSDINIATVTPNSGNLNDSLTIVISPTSDNDDQYAAITITTADGVSEYIYITRKGTGQSHYVPHPFSIGENKKVYFSPGNLQYQASTNTWRFAGNQFLFVGCANFDRFYLNGNVYENGTKCDNAQISRTYSGWIDLFGWGTGANPTLHTELEDNYHTFVDWGTNPIHYKSTTYPSNTWRTLTYDEWRYLIFSNVGRVGAELRGLATVNNIKGCVLLPDDWDMPTGTSFVSDAKEYQTNVYTLKQWWVMEAHGAVFLPAAGFRIGDMSNEEVVQTYLRGYLHGNYWSCTSVENSSTYPYAVSIDNTLGITISSCRKPDGFSVRLVQDVE